MPHACIGVDVIVGFPGETEEEFNKTIDYIKSLPVSYLHVFTYSERANTNAPKMNEVVPMDIRRKRSKQLRILSLKLKLQFYKENIGHKGKVLFESKEDNFLIGFTENYLKVKIPFKPKMHNTIQEVRIEKISSDIEAFGSIVKELELIK
jgi:threonylcarbamoyladenosine tRNA methylthiotransferase MtaB